MRRSTVAATVAFVCLVAWAALVAAGVLHGFDRYAVDHWMPWLGRGHHPLLDLRALLVPARHGSIAERAVDAWTYPASVPISALIVAGCAWVLWRRGLRHAAATLAVLWVSANLIELAGKLALRKPALDATRHGVTFHVVGFDHSFPSGHTIRGALAAFAVAYTWRRAAPFAAAWFATIPFALVALGDHTPTDVIGGALAAVVLLAFVPPRPVRPVQVLRSPDPKRR
jgi:membrane-associated phospholipid phosphatase